MPSNSLEKLTKLLKVKDEKYSELELRKMQVLPHLLDQKHRALEEFRESIQNIDERLVKVRQDEAKEKEEVQMLLLDHHNRFRKELKDLSEKFKKKTDDNLAKMNRELEK